MVILYSKENIESIIKDLEQLQKCSYLTLRCKVKDKEFDELSSDELRNIFTQLKITILFSEAIDKLEECKYYHNNYD